MTPNSLSDLFQRLETQRPDLPKRLAQCADFITEHRDRVALGTVAELAAEAGVSPSAMMRFAQAMGFAGFTDMQRLFRAALRGALPDYGTRLQVLREAGAGSPSALLAEFVEAGRSSLETLATSVDAQVLDQAAARLAQADAIHIMGLRRAFPVATYMAYAYEKMEIPTILHQSMGKLSFHNALREGDAAIAVTFAPYSPETLEFIAAASQRGLPLVVITDTRAALPDGGEVLPLLVSEVDFGAFRSLSATLTLAISLAVAVGARRDAGRAD